MLTAHNSNTFQPSATLACIFLVSILPCYCNYMASERRPYTTYFKTSDRGTDDKLERAILRSLIPPYSFTEFRVQCKHHPKLFGSPGKSRKASRSRRDKLKKLRNTRYGEFVVYCKDFSIETCPATLEECIQGEAEDSDELESVSVSTASEIQSPRKSSSSQVKKTMPNKTSRTLAIGMGDKGKIQFLLLLKCAMTNANIPSCCHFVLQTKLSSQTLMMNSISTICSLKRTMALWSC